MPYPFFSPRKKPNPNNLNSTGTVVGVWYNQSTVLTDMFYLNKSSFPEICRTPCVCLSRQQLNITSGDTVPVYNLDVLLPSACTGGNVVEWLTVSLVKSKILGLSLYWKAQCFFSVKFGTFIIFWYKIIYPNRNEYLFHHCTLRRMRCTTVINMRAVDLGIFFKLFLNTVIAHKCSI